MGLFKNQCLDRFRTAINISEAIKMIDTDQKIEQDMKRWAAQQLVKESLEKHFVELMELGIVEWNSYKERGEL